LTFPFADWARDMKELTDGRWDIEIHYGGVLAPGREGIDGLKAGMFEAVLYTSMYGPGKLPLSTVMQLPFMGPPTVEQTGDWFMAVQEHPALVKEVNSWNARILFPTPLRQYNYMGKVPIQKAEDFDGVRIRIDSIAGAPLVEYGAVPTMMPGGDIYTALERGMLDGVLWQWTYTFGAYKLYELSKYATLGIDLKLTDMYCYVNQDAWNKLPDEWKKLANYSTNRAGERYSTYLKEADLKWIPIFTKAGIEVHEFPAAERAKLMEKALPTWNTWVKDIEAQGLPGQEVLDFAIAKRNEIIAKAEAEAKK